jgi:TonB family protein
VEILRVPIPKLGFEQVVSACVSKWRYEPATGGASLRSVDGFIDYHIADADERALRLLMEGFASAWNAKDVQAVRPLLGGPLAAPTVGTKASTPLLEQFAKERAAADWDIQLDPEVEWIKFLRPDVMAARQPIRLSRSSKSDGKTHYLDVTAIKRGDEWTLLAWFPGFAGPPASSSGWVAPGIEFPRKRKHPFPNYPSRTASGVIVVLDAEVDTSGKVVSVETRRSEPGFDDYALRAVKHWTYKPMFFEGTPIPFFIRAHFTFNVGSSNASVGMNEELFLKRPD